MDSSQYLRTHVQEHEIQVTRNRLAELLGCHDDGPNVDAIRKFNWGGDWRP